MIIKIYKIQNKETLICCEKNSIIFWYDILSKKSEYIN